ncbi:MAG: hypothetical protein V1921_02410 [Candidatus Altiarchaeota archaeon]
MMVKRCVLDPNRTCNSSCIAHSPQGCAVTNMPSMRRYSEDLGLKEV